MSHQACFITFNYFKWPTYLTFTFIYILFHVFIDIVTSRITLHTEHLYGYLDDNCSLNNPINILNKGDY